MPKFTLVINRTHSDPRRLSSYPSLDEAIAEAKLLLARHLGRGSIFCPTVDIIYSVDGSVAETIIPDDLTAEEASR